VPVLYAARELQKYWHIAMHTDGPETNLPGKDLGVQRTEMLKLE